MKVRTDFVTNSSSSSFIFKKATSMEELDKEIKEVKKKFGREKYKWWDDECYNDGIQMLKQLKGLLIPVKELDTEIMEEIFEWYYDDLVCSILGKDAKENLVAKFIIDGKVKVDYTVKQLHKIFLVFALDLALHKIYSPDVLPEKQPLTKVFTYQEMKNAVASYISDAIEIPYSLKKVVYQIFIDNYEEGIEFFEENHFSCLELFQEIFDCEYVYYEDYSVNVIFADILRNIPSCTYACGHMG